MRYEIFLEAVQKTNTKIVSIYIAWQEQIDVKEEASSHWFIFHFHFLLNYFFLCVYELENFEFPDCKTFRLKREWFVRY